MTVPESNRVPQSEREAMPARSILAWLAIGLLVGALGGLFVRRQHPVNMTASILIGIAGALLAGFLAQTMQLTPGSTWQNFVISAFGAVAVLAVYVLAGQRRS